jgi:hypothetical protein
MDYDLWFITNVCVVGDPEVIRPAKAEFMFAYRARSKALSLISY